MSQQKIVQSVHGGGQTDSKEVRSVHVIIQSEETEVSAVEGTVDNIL